VESKVYAQTVKKASCQPFQGMMLNIEDAIVEKALAVPKPKSQKASRRSKVPMATKYPSMFDVIFILFILPLLSLCRHELRAPIQHFPTLYMRFLNKGEVVTFAIEITAYIESYFREENTKL